MRAILLVTLVSISLFSACSGSESERVYAEAKKCAESIFGGGACPPQQNQKGGTERANGSGDAGQQAAQPEDGTPQNTAPQETRVYIDASESMRGFAAAPDNSFVTVIEALSYAMPGCRLFKYGFPGERRVAAADGQLAFAHEIRFSQELRRPSFYDLAFNEDDALIKHLAQEDPPARSVLLTDGVYSARNTELQSEVVKAIEQWLDKGRFFGILIFTSAFDGKLYSENNRAWTESVRVSARPFYAFIFSPTEKEFRELREQLGGEVKIEGSFAFPREAVSCAVIPQDKEGLEKKDVPPRNPFYLHMYNADVFEGKNQADLFFDLRCTPAPDYPVAVFKPEPTLDAYTWQQNSFRKNERPPQFTHQYTEQAAASVTPTPAPEKASHAGMASPSPTPAAPRQPNLKLTLSHDGTASYNLYHLRFDLSGRALHPSIRNLSTQDDGLISEAGKTYRFYEFISSLTTMHLQNKKAMATPPPVFIAIANK